MLCKCYHYSRFIKKIKKYILFSPDTMRILSWIIVPHISWFSLHFLSGSLAPQLTIDCCTQIHYLPSPVLQFLYNYSALSSILTLLLTSLHRINFWLICCHYQLLVTNGFSLWTFWYSSNRTLFFVWMWTKTYLSL